MNNGLNWKDEIRLARKAGYSNTVIVVTDDPKRNIELLAWLTKGKLLEKEEEIFIVSTWQGLRTWDGESESFDAVKDKRGGEIKGFSLSTKYVYDRMRKYSPLPENKSEEKTPAILVYSNILEKGVGTDQILLDLINDTSIQTNHSTFVVVIPSETILDERVRKQAIVVKPPISTKDERKAIITGLLDKVNKGLGKKAAIKIDKNKKEQIVNITAGLNLNQTEAAISESILAYRDLDNRFIADFKAKEINKLGYITVNTTPKFGFEGIGGYAKVKKFLDEKIVQKVINRERANTLGIRYPRGIVFFGEPGTGKTVLSKALAKECGLPFFELKISQIKSKFVGESEQQLENALRIIDDNSPCIVFIDEIDRLGGRSGGDNDGGTSRELFSMLLSWLGDEDRNAIVVGTTNEPLDCDEAFRRVGRIDYWIPVRLPDDEAKVAILKVHTSIKNVVPLADDVDFKSLVKEMKHWNGAEVQNLVERAQDCALVKDAEIVTKEDFEKGLWSVRVPLDKRKAQIEKYDGLLDDVCNDMHFFPETSGSKETLADPLSFE